MATELSELRAELWRTRDDLERMKSRTPSSVGRSQSSSRAGDHRRRADGTGASRDRDPHQGWRDQGERASKGLKHVKDRSGRLSGGSGMRSGPTSPPTSGESSPGSEVHKHMGISAASDGERRAARSRTCSSGIGIGPEEEAAAEETLCNLELEGAAFKNWTEEASSIAVRLIEEVKMLRWERAGWVERDAAAERTVADLRARAENFETRLRSAEAERERLREALVRAQQEERDQAQTVERAKADLRAAQEKAGELRAHTVRGSSVAVRGEVSGLREELRREKEGADALQRRLDVARAAVARHERERKEWQTSRARLEDLRRSWGKHLKKVEKKIKSMTKDSAVLKARAADAERARGRADSSSMKHRDELCRLTEQRDNLLLGATRAGCLSASSPADALVELLAAATAGVATGAACPPPSQHGLTTATSNGTPGSEAWDKKIQDTGGSNGSRAAEGLEVELEQARAEAKLARVAIQQERLRRESAAREKDQAVRQLHRLMGAAKRAVGRRDSRLRSSRLETEVVWNALTEAVR